MCHNGREKIANNLVLPKRHWIIYYDSKFVWLGHEYSWFDHLSQYSNKTLTVHHFADDTNMLLINKSLIKTINKNINHDMTLFKYI